MPATSSFLQAFLEPIFGRWLYADSGLWTVVGFLGAAIFGSRFVLQWLQSEKEKKLVVPWYFWHLSFWGSVLNLLYFLHLDKAPLILGNCFLPFLYGRNILFLRAEGEKGRGRLVFAAVAVLTIAGFAVSAFTSDASASQSRVARLPQEIKTLQEAVALHTKEYGTTPSGSSTEIVRTLAGENPRKIHFLKIQADEVSPEGKWLDPWGHPYQILLSGKTLLMRSAGPNGVFDDGNQEKRDDILLEAVLP